MLVKYSYTDLVPISGAGNAPMDRMLAVTLIAITGLMIWVSWAYTIRIFVLGSRSENAGIALWLPHGVLAIAFTLMLLAAAVHLLGNRAAGHGSMTRRHAPQR